MPLTSPGNDDDTGENHQPTLRKNTAEPVEQTLKQNTALGTGVSEKVIRRIMAEGGLSAHVPKRRRYSSYEGETTPAPGNLVNRDFTAERPNEKWLTDITEIKARDGKVYLSPMIDCHDGKIVAYTAGFHPNAELANRMLAEAAETLPDNARPVVHSD